MITLELVKVSSGITAKGSWTLINTLSKSFISVKFSMPEANKKAIPMDSTGVINQAPEGRLGEKQVSGDRATATKQKHDRQSKHR